MKRAIVHYAHWLSDTLDSFFLIAPQGHFFQGTFGEYFVFSQSGYKIFLALQLRTVAQY